MELGQQLLVEPEGARDVTAPPGACWWGVDSSTLRVSIAARGEDFAHATTRSFPRAQGPRRLAFIYAETYQFTLDSLGVTPSGGFRYWPGFVLIEQPSGKKPNPNLVYAVGVIQAAVYAALHGARGDRPIPVVETVPSATWKARGIGGPWQTLNKAAGDIIRLAREDGYTGQSEDEADAWFMAKAARRTVRFA
jgi:hypothetical protein